MLRDNLKNKSYFDEYIAYEKKRINKFTDICKNIPTDQEERIFQCLRYIASFERNLFTAMYSAGCSKVEMDESVRKYISLLCKIGTSNYAEKINVLSLAYLFNVSAEDMSGVLKETIHSDDLTEFLNNIIINPSQVVSVGSKVLFKDKYIPFVNFINNNIDMVSFADYMENNWYKSNQDSFWFDAHKSESNIYSGYWCWLAAAILKAKKIPLTNAKIKYVPYELI